MTTNYQSHIGVVYTLVVKEVQYIYIHTHGKGVKMLILMVVVIWWDEGRRCRAQSFVVDSGSS